MLVQFALDIVLKELKNSEDISLTFWRCIYKDLNKTSDHKMATKVYLNICGAVANIGITEGCKKPFTPYFLWFFFQK